MSKKCAGLIVGRIDRRFFVKLKRLVNTGCIKSIVGIGAEQDPAHIQVVVGEGAFNCTTTHIVYLHQDRRTIHERDSG